LTSAVQVPWSTHRTATYPMKRRSEAE